jgi:hypothetical protein
MFNWFAYFTNLLIYVKPEIRGSLNNNFQNENSLPNLAGPLVSNKNFLLTDDDIEINVIKLKNTYKCFKTKTFNFFDNYLIKQPCKNSHSYQYSRKLLREYEDCVEEIKSTFFAISYCVDLKHKNKLLGTLEKKIIKFKKIYKNVKSFFASPDIIKIDQKKTTIDNYCLEEKLNRLTSGLKIDWQNLKALNLAINEYAREKFDLIHSMHTKNPFYNGLCDSLKKIIDQKIIKAHYILGNFCVIRASEIFEKHFYYKGLLECVKNLNVAVDDLQDLFSSKGMASLLSIQENYNSFNSFIGHLVNISLLFRDFPQYYKVPDLDSYCKEVSNVINNKLSAINNSIFNELNGAFLNLSLLEKDHFINFKRYEISDIIQYAIFSEQKIINLAAELNIQINEFLTIPSIQIHKNRLNRIDNVNSL